MRPAAVTARAKAAFRHRGKDGANIEIAGRSCASQADGIIGSADVRAVSIILGEHGNRMETQLGCGADNPERDFTTVGDQHGSDGGHRSGEPHCTS
jgi:hypothetical protein